MASSEGEHEDLDARVKEFDLEQPAADLWGLTNELIHPLVVGGAVTALVDVDAVGPPRGLAVEAHPETYGRVPNRWPHHEMEVTTVELIPDGPTRLIEQRGHQADRPVA